MGNRISRSILRLLAIEIYIQNNSLKNRAYLLGILQKSLDRALSLCNFIHEVRSSGVRANISIVHQNVATYHSILIPLQNG